MSGINCRQDERNFPRKLLSQEPDQVTQLLIDRRIVTHRAPNFFANDPGEFRLQIESGFFHLTFAQAETRSDAGVFFALCAAREGDAQGNEELSPFRPVFSQPDERRIEDFTRPMAIESGFWRFITLGRETTERIEFVERDGRRATAALAGLRAIPLVIKPTRKGREQESAKTSFARLDEAEEIPA